jgi:cobalt-zinc-cadmium efflux system protein
VLGDLLGSLAALVSGIIVWATGWIAVDPALSLFLALLLAYSSLKLVREAFHGLMEGVPLHLSLEEIGKAMAGVEGVTSVHDLHIWSLTAERIALSAHVVIGGLDSWPETLIRLQALLAQRYGIEHVTLQPEISEQTPTVVSAPRVVSLTENFTVQRPAQGRDR